jgi:hypothetical protein
MARIFIGFERFVKKKSVTFRLGDVPYFLNPIPLGGCVNKSEQIRFFVGKIFLRGSVLAACCILRFPESTPRNSKSQSGSRFLIRKAGIEGWDIRDGR